MRFSARTGGRDPVERQAPGQHPSKGSKHRTVSPVRSRAGDLPPQDRDLVPQQEDFRVLGGTTTCQQLQPSEQPDHEQVDKTD